MHDPPFWEEQLKSEYERFWLPRDPIGTSVSVIDLPTNSCFHRIIYDYPCGSRIKRVKRISATGTPAIIGKKRKRYGNDTISPPKKKRKTFSKKVVPENYIIKTIKMRIFPTSQQRKLFKTWFAAARGTYNFALGILKNHYRQGIRLIDPTNRISLKEQFVTCRYGKNRFPKRWRWMEGTPYSIREQATSELSLAYQNGFNKVAQGRPFGRINFRSKRDHNSFTIPSANFNKADGKRWSFYPSYLPGDSGNIKFHKRDINRVISRYPNGPEHGVNIVMTRTGRYFMCARLQVKKEELKEGAVGHLVGLDPGVSPMCTYYSPTRMETGSFGTLEDTETILRRGQAVYEKISSRLDSNRENDTYLPQSLRKKLRRKRLRLLERRRDMIMETIHKTVKYLSDNYQYIHGSIFEVSNMVKKPKVNPIQDGIARRRTISRKTTREMLSWRHGVLKTKLQNKMLFVNDLLVELSDEAYTTQTCGFCGKLNAPDKKKYVCSHCGYRVHRDVGGGRNHLLKNAVRKYEWC